MDLALAVFLPAVVTAGIMPCLARSARPLGLLDVPSARSSHTAPVPRVGGIGVFVGLAAGVVGLAVHGGLDAASAWSPYLLPLLLYFLIGLADDAVQLRSVTKFLAQGVVAAWAVYQGLRWDGAALAPFGALHFGTATPYLTWLWLVAVVILVNFVDGIDLITSVVAIVMLGAAAGGGAGPGDGLLYAAATGAVLGLAFWNVTPARVFPGDAGTHMLGFLLATVACGVPDRGGAEVLTRGLPWVAASAPLLPGVIDVALGLAGKARRGVSLGVAHNDHLYQRLTKIGHTHVAVALRYGGLTLIGLLLVTQVAPAWGLGACFGLAALVLAWHLGGGLCATRNVPWGSSDSA